MINPFEKKYTTGDTDERLVESAVNGDRKSLEELVYRHQAWIYNISLRMIFYPAEAEDATQEILVKIITKLSTFRGKSSFRTWAYRVAVNHLLNMKKSIGEKRHSSSFSEYWQSIDATPDMDFPDSGSLPVDSALIVEEVKVSCMFGMLLCLDREQRMIFILGAVFGVSDSVGSEIMEITRDNFRQRLSRARHQIYNFMNDKCGLIRKSNPCRCERKTKALLESGYVNPDNLLFSRNYYSKVESVTHEKTKQMDELFDSRCRSLFRSHPFQDPPDFVESIRSLINTKEFKKIFNFIN